MKLIILSILIFLSISQSIAVTNSDVNDTVRITSEKELTGPGGLKMSCAYIARFEEMNRRDFRRDGNDIYDSQRNKRPRFTRNEEFFNVKYSDWTPEIVEYLKNAVDKCVAERLSFKNLFFEKSDGYVELSPSSAKQLFDDIYAISLATKKFDEEQAENQKQYALQKHNQEIELQEHIQKLKNGEEKVNSVSDAILYYSPSPLNPIIVSPLLKPDSQYYSGEVIIDFQETKNVLRAKIENYWDMRGGAKLYQIAYAFLRTDKKTISYNPELLRIGQHIKVVGRYVNNVPYTTIAGEMKVSPVLQVLYMGVE